MKLGLLGFFGNNVRSRTDNLGIYRPESNRHIQSYNGKSRFYQFWGQKQVISSSTLKTITGLTFKTDGTEVYILSDGDNTIYQYNLPIPWDITSIPSITPTSSAELDSYLRTRTGNSYSLTVPTGVSISSDGSLMTIVDNYDRKIVQFTLSTPWDVSSRTFTNTTIDANRTLWLIPNCDLVSDICFSSTGNRLFTLVENTSNVMSVYQFNINNSSLLFDIGTKGSPNYTYSSPSLDVSGLDTSMRGIAFNNDGTKFYLSGLQNGRIYDLSTRIPFSWSVDYPVNYDEGDYLYDGFISGREGSPQAVAINTEANSMDLYVVGTSTQNIIYQYKLIQR